MESQNAPDVLAMAGKRKQGYEYLSTRQEIAETKLREKNVETAIFQRSLEEHKRSVEEHKRSVAELTERFRTTKVSLEEQKSNVQQLTEEVSNRNSRVLRLEADKFFMASFIFLLIHSRRSSRKVHCGRGLTAKVHAITIESG